MNRGKFFLLLLATTAGTAALSACRGGEAGGSAGTYVQRSVSELVADLKSPDVAIRLRAAQGLGRFTAERAGELQPVVEEIKKAGKAESEPRIRQILEEVLAVARRGGGGR